MNARTTGTVVIGAGHAGLAMSRRLTERSIDHVVLERGEVANSWRNERWDSLRLLTPNWMNRLPGLRSDGGQDRHGFMAAPQVVTMLAGYARDVDAPVQTQTTVTRVHPASGGYAVETDRGGFRCRSLVVASGTANVARVPAMAAGLPPSLVQVTALSYRTPDRLPPGAALVVGASATGVQLAEEIHRSGRPVTLSVGEHVRLPRRYRGRDIMWWLDRAGVLDERWDEVDDLERARHLPSPQLIGSPVGRSVDLNSLGALGVRIVGRLGRIVGSRAQFSGSLANTAALADLKLNRLLTRLDDWAAATRLDGVDAPERFASTAIPAPPVLDVDLRDFATVVWATGHRPDYRWLDVPVLDRKGRIRHTGGVVTDAPGIYVVGVNLLTTRRSSYIDGAAADTAHVADALERHSRPLGV